MNGFTAELMKFHDRILEQLSRVEQVVHRIHRSQTPSTDLRLSSQEIDAFFEFMNGIAAKHVVHEERMLFPVISGHLSSQEYTLIDMLKSDHRKAKELLVSQEKRFSELNSETDADPADCRHFCRAMTELITFYRHHIWKENKVLFPLAERVLTKKEFEQISTDSPV